MEKQHNRGQEGAGIASVKLDARRGDEYIFREKALGSTAITEIFDKINAKIDFDKGQNADADYAKEHLPFASELYMGHLRYSSTGKAGLDFIHPFLRRDNWCAKSLVICGNFSLTNVEDVYEDLVRIGQHPRRYADTHLLLDQLGHGLDMEIEYLYRECQAEGFEGAETTKEIDKRFDVSKLLKRCSPIWDGGYVVSGMTGSGETFTMRDPWGIRSAFYYADDEIVVVASERPVIQTAMNVPINSVKELNSGEALIVDRRGKLRIVPILEPKEKKACSFERIYFSRGSDADIYKERKMLGELLVEPILKSVDYDIDNTVLSFIPNTAEVAYFGMLNGFEKYLNKQKIEYILQHRDKLDEAELEKVLSRRIRSEKVAIKDIKLRTFIAQGKARNDMAAHVYDVTYGTIVDDVDNLVVIDDSIVRGTTLKQSILKILDRLNPKRIVIVSSSPQVRYPDCYGIDMSSMSEFIAFRAAVELLHDRNMESVIEETYNAAKEQIKENPAQYVNFVKNIYAPFTDEEISEKIAEMLHSEGLKAEIKIVYQTIDGLHQSCPDHLGDWYFSGDFPTNGGMKFVNEAFIDYFEKEYKK